MSLRALETSADPESLLPLLHSAAQTGDLETVQRVLENDPDTVDSGDFYGRTALLLAANEGHYDVLRCLLAHGASVDLPDRKLRTALYVAVKGQHDTSKHGVTLVRPGMEPVPNFNFMSFDGMEMEDQEKLKTILYGGEDQKEEEDDREGTESPSGRHSLNVHAQVFVPKAIPTHQLVGAPYVQFDNVHVHHQPLLHGQISQHVVNHVAAQHNLQHSLVQQLQQNHVHQMNQAAIMAAHMAGAQRMPAGHDGQRNQQFAPRVNDHYSQYRMARPPRHQNMRDQRDQRFMNDNARQYHPDHRFRGAGNKRITVLQNPNSRRYNGSRNDGHGHGHGHGHDRGPHPHSHQNNLPPRFCRQQRESVDRFQEQKRIDEDINSNMLKLQNGLEPKHDARSSPDESDDERITVSLNSGASNVKWPSDDSKTCSPQSRSLSPASSAASEAKSPASSANTKPAENDIDSDPIRTSNNRDYYVNDRYTPHNRRGFAQRGSGRNPRYDPHPRYDQGRNNNRRDRTPRPDFSSDSMEGMELRRSDLGDWSESGADPNSEWGSIEPDTHWTASAFPQQADPIAAKLPIKHGVKSEIDKGSEGERCVGRNNSAVEDSSPGDIIVEPVHNVKKDTIDSKGAVQNVNEKDIVDSPSTAADMVVEEKVMVNDTAGAEDGKAEQVNAKTEAAEPAKAGPVPGQASPSHPHPAGPEKPPVQKRTSPEPSITIPPISATAQNSNPSQGAPAKGGAPQGAPVVAKPTQGAQASGGAPSRSESSPAARSTAAKPPQQAPAKEARAQTAPPKPAPAAPAKTAPPAEKTAAAASQPGAAATAKPAPAAEKGAPPQAAPAPPAGAWGAPRRSWAALVSHNLPSQPAVVIPAETPPLKPEAPPPANDREEEEEEETGDVSNDRLVKKLREYLKTASLHHRPPSVFPRGLINRANWCYVNSTLQALLACPPFYNLLRNLPRIRERGHTCTPVIDAVCEYVHQFTFMKPVPNRNKKHELPTIQTGEPFEPDYVYKMLLKLKSTGFKEGRQEDAEEFLTCVLNHMHDELLAITNNQNGSDALKPEPTPEESDDWEQVGRKKKAVITRSNEMPRSLVSDIFCGQIRSVLRSSGSRESATLEPFFTLPLDIQNEKIRSVKDALSGLVSRESIQGFTCSKTKEEVEATRCQMLDLLPPVLILHLKCFIYDKNGGCQKLAKEIEYTVDLEISKDIISQNARGKIRDHQRSYKLFAVVYHHGKTLQGGHYTTDVYHSGINGWIRIDDHNITVVPVTQVLQYTVPHMPYLLYYRRHDSLGSLDRK